MNLLCGCGCGTPIPPTKHPRRDPAQFVRGHNQRLNRLALHVYDPKPDEIPSGVCECGCGGATPIATVTYHALRWFRGYPKPFLPGHHSRLSNKRQKLKAGYWSRTERAYLAGLIDGEGNIQVRGAERSVRVSIANTHQPLMDWLVERFGGLVANNAPHANRLDVLKWHVGHRLDSRRLLTAVLPFLRIKRAAAERALACLARLPPEQMRQRCQSVTPRSR